MSSGKVSQMGILGLLVISLGALGASFYCIAGMLRREEWSFKSDFRNAFSKYGVNRYYVDGQNCPELKDRFIGIEALMDKYVIIKP